MVLPSGLPLAAVTWWAWTLAWVVLVAAGAAVLYLAARRLLRQGLALVRELGAAADAFADVTNALEGGVDAVADTAPPRARRAPRRTP
jgi:hypothetical protein